MSFVITVPEMLNEDFEHEIILNRCFELQKSLQCASKLKYLYNTCSCSFIAWQRMLCLNRERKWNFGKEEKRLYHYPSSVHSMIVQ